MNNLDISSRIKLCFQNKCFKILMLSDIQEDLDFDKRTISSLNNIIENTHPDLIVLGGDTCDGQVVKGIEDTKKYLDTVLNPIEKHNIPWMHIFGNHDHDSDIDQILLTQMYESYPHCISKHTNGIYGATNYMVPIYDENKEDIIYALWALDTNNRIEQSGLNFPYDMTTINRMQTAFFFDTIHFDQLSWFYNSAKNLDIIANKRVPATLFMHNAPAEFQYLFNNKDLCGTIGSTEEDLLLAALNSGIFALSLQLETVRCIACGHSHMDTASGEFCGITCCLDGTAGFKPYGIDKIRGGRVIEINTDDLSSVKTYMVHYEDII